MAAQAINPAASFAFVWDPIPGGLLSDFVQLSIEDASSGNDIYSSPDLGAPGAMNGTSTSVAIPPGTLVAGTRYEVNLAIFHPIDFDTSYTTAVSAYGKTTTMEIATSGGTDNDPPNFIRSAPRHQEAHIETNSIVTFEFGEPMDTAISAGAAISWTGGTDPAQFSYSWSPDGRTLFCKYAPGLPVSTTINWLLNPPKSAVKLRDAAGNPLIGSPSGRFQTAATSSTGVADVSSIALLQARAYHHASHDGMRTVSLPLGAAGYPPAPVIQNLSALQTTDSNQDLVLQWAPWPGGTVSDYIVVRVENEHGNVLFESPDIGLAGALDGTATSVTIPAGSLPPGRELEAEIGFIKVISSDTTQYPGVPAISAVASGTGFELLTTGAPFTPILEVMNHTGSELTLRLTGELGRSYAIRSWNTLPLQDNPVWFGQLQNRDSGFRAAYEHTDSGVVGLLRQFYQADEFIFIPPGGTP